MWSILSRSKVDGINTISIKLCKSNKIRVHFSNEEEFLKNIILYWNTHQNCLTNKTTVLRYTYTRCTIHASLVLVWYKLLFAFLPTRRIVSPFIIRPYTEPNTFTVSFLLFRQVAKTIFSNPHHTASPPSPLVVLAPVATWTFFGRYAA